MPARDSGCPTPDSITLKNSASLFILRRPATSTTDSRAWGQPSPPICASRNQPARPEVSSLRRCSVLPLQDVQQGLRRSIPRVLYHRRLEAAMYHELPAQPACLTRPSAQKLSSLLHDSRVHRERA